LSERAALSRGTFRLYVALYALIAMLIALAVDWTIVIGSAR
jgi:hypothetical protein